MSKKEPSLIVQIVIFAKTTYIQRTMNEYPQIELSQWTKVGEGFNGQAYVSHAHPGVMLKLVTGDLGWLSQGYYMMDLAHLYKMMVEDSFIPQVQDLTHMTQQQMVDFWNTFAVAYTGTKDIEALNRELKPYAALDLVRTSYLHHMDNPEILAFFKARITQDLS